MLYEIHDIKRFPTEGQFLSDCRLVKGSHTSADKSYGSPGKKIGNAHLKWASSEAVPLLKRCSPEAGTFVDRIEKKRGKARAFSYLAVKLGRAVYYMPDRISPKGRSNTRKKQSEKIKDFYRATGTDYFIPKAI